MPTPNTNSEFINFIIDNVRNENLRNELLSKYFRTHTTTRNSLSSLETGLSNITNSLNTIDVILQESFETAPLPRQPTLTNSQFNMVPTKSFAQIISENGSNTEYTCSVCRNDFVGSDQLKCLPCNHYFHTRCIKNWLVRRNNKCPNCRQVVSLPTNDTPTTSRSNIEQSNHTTQTATTTTTTTTNTNSDANTGNTSFVDDDNGNTSDDASSDTSGSDNSQTIGDTHVITTTTTTTSNPTDIARLILPLLRMATTGTFTVPHQ